MGPFLPAWECIKSDLFPGARDRILHLGYSKDSSDWAILLLGRYGQTEGSTEKSRGTEWSEAAELNHTLLVKKNLLQR